MVVVKLDAMEGGALSSSNVATDGSARVSVGRCKLTGTHDGRRLLVKSTNRQETDEEKNRAKERKESSWLC